MLLKDKLTIKRLVELSQSGSLTKEESKQLIKTAAIICSLIDVDDANDKAILYLKKLISK